MNKIFIISSFIFMILFSNSYCDDAPMPSIINISVTADITKDGVQKQISKNVNCELSTYQYNRSWYTSAEFEDFKITEFMYYRNLNYTLFRLSTCFDEDYELTVNQNIQNITLGSTDVTTQYSLTLQPDYTGTVKVKINYVKWNDGTEEGSLPTDIPEDEAEELTNQTNNLLTVIAITLCIIMGLYCWRIIILSKNQRNMI